MTPKARKGKKETIIQIMASDKTLFVLTSEGRIFVIDNKRKEWELIELPI